MMEAVTDRIRIRGVAAAWREAYPEPVETFDGPSEDIAKALAALDPEVATHEEVEAIIGNPTWTRQRCDECGQAADRCVRLGEEPDRESATVYICRSCLCKAIDLLDATP